MNLMTARLCQCGRNPPHNQLFCPTQRVQMTNLQANYQMIESDEETAQNHLAMAEMEREDDGAAGAEVEAVEQPSIMQFMATQTGTYNNQETYYNQFSINDISNYIGSFFKNDIPN